MNVYRKFVPRPLSMAVVALFVFVGSACGTAPATGGNVALVAVTPGAGRFPIAKYLPRLFPNESTHACGINNDGWIVGATDKTGDLDSVAVLWRNGKAIAIAPAPSSQSFESG